MGKGGGAPPAPDPMAAIRAQQAEQERQKQERYADADRFLGENRMTDDWRQGIFDQSYLARDAQIGSLDTQL